MRMSSRYTTTKVLVNGCKISSIILMKVVGQRAWPTIQKGLPLTWRQSSIHLFVLWRLGGSQTSYESYWSIWPPWVDQRDRRFMEAGTDSWLWFYLGPGNQCRVARSHLSSAPARLGSHKVMRWDGCGPCGAVLRSVAWSPHSLTESSGRLTDWEEIRHGSDQWDAWFDSAEIP